ncbi:hypothetical protein BH23BAC1_BH23BAC1_50430 [soil metagenome]
MPYLQTSKIYLIGGILYLYLISPVYSQEPIFVQLENEPAFSIAPGEEKNLLISFLIKPGYHIQANRVKDENLIPSVLSIDISEKLTLSDPIFPSAVEFRMSGVEEPLLVYNDVLKIYIPVKVAKTEEKGEIFVKGKLHYQACDASSCYFPRDLNFQMKINIE